MGRSSKYSQMTSSSEQKALPLDELEDVANTSAKVSRSCIQNCAVICHGEYATPPPKK